MAAPQTFKNHGRIVPMYHMGVFFPLLLNFVWSIYRLTRGVTADSVIALLVSIALLLMFFSLRRQVLTVQDRVIRLEMRLRLRQVLPPDLLPQIDTLSLSQLIALRFASDAELVGLVREVLAGRLAAPKDIKGQVKDWQADYQRA
jgi:hypothetical protein